MLAPQVILLAIFATSLTAAQDITFISNGALQRNTVPCDMKHSPSGRCITLPPPSNTYTHGCTVISRCARPAPGVKVSLDS
ncbi:uncharacterized protein EKO05_0005328 [Ascochyta rabiei]|uniref:uncharacterized protein n=1 Tax=Didymella rabiei TaxID=5454 RepID=UPI00220C7302|nr:uncharacterized protein EKO05_0005328 [Ascochyta rabiei]UPX14857.1 hypothetical protein EKO05_0005328 [Ascochyta rabiei]